MFFNYSLLGLDCTKAGVTAMRVPPGAPGNFCPVFVKASLSAAANGILPIVPPTISIGTVAPWNCILAAAGLPAGLITPGYHSTLVLGVAPHGINGNISVKVVTPAVATVYLIDILLLGILC